MAKKPEELWNSEMASVVLTFPNGAIASLKHATVSSANRVDTLTYAETPYASAAPYHMQFVICWQLVGAAGKVPPVMYEVQKPGLNTSLITLVKSS
jgi:hypothetical protein